MKIIIHDYAGYPFPVQLSRELARRGHQVLHLYAGYNTTPRGELDCGDSDPGTLSIRGIFIRRPLDKYSFIMRWLQEREYGRLLAKEVKAYHPDLVLSADTPLDAQARLLNQCRKSGAGFIFWVQDLIGIATKILLAKKLPVLGSLLGRYYIRLEKELLRRSDGIVVIAEDFQKRTTEWGIPPGKVSVIPNWAVLEDLDPQPKANPWAEAHGLCDKFCFMYTGTLGMKHNPELLLQLALSYRHDPRVSVAVVSEGPGAQWLRQKIGEYHLKNLSLFDFQPFKQLSYVLGTADVLVAILESESGFFSVPSKVLTYLCARRPLLLSIPLENLAAKIVLDQQAGLVVDPAAPESFLQAAGALYRDPGLCNSLANNARSYAEKTFLIRNITDRFEQVIWNSSLQPYQRTSASLQEASG